MPDPPSHANVGMGADAPKSATVMDPPVSTQAIAGLDRMVQSMGLPPSAPQDTYDYQQPS